ncbi:MAG: DUF411 domain-containing protein [Altererythrobacter sp.]|nr:DUF411 domain-containing protein [Altererythrobacter sp.]
MIRTTYLAPLALLACANAAAAATLEVAKSPSCGCCSVWIERMRSAGFTVKSRDVVDTTPVASAAGVPDQLRSCHTTKVAGYVIEGHVPAADIRRLLAQKPKAIGLAAPGMPMGSPGMEMGGRKERYQVMLIARDGSHTVWATHGGN